MKDFSEKAEQALYHIAETIEKEDKDCLLDVDFFGDIINITTSQGVFVINKHSAAKEIWLASPVSGPYHFKLEDDLWKSKGGDDLLTVLSTELHIKFEYTE